MTVGYITINEVSRRGDSWCRIYRVLVVTDNRRVGCRVPARPPAVTEVFVYTKYVVGDVPSLQPYTSHCDISSSVWPWKLLWQFMGIQGFSYAAFPRDCLMGSFFVGCAISRRLFGTLGFSGACVAPHVRLHAPSCTFFLGVDDGT